MAVITRYIVVRDGVELDKVFEDKKEAEAYDKMLDAADQLAGFIKENAAEIDLAAEVIDDLSVFLAKNGPEVSKILKGIKGPSSTGKQRGRKPAAADPEKEGKKAAPEGESAGDPEKPSRPGRPKGKAK